MSLSKVFLKHRPICRVTFKIPKHMVKGASHVCLLGEFNQWNPSATPMRPLQSGAYSQSLYLEKDKEFQFRYLIGGDWENDPDADKYVMSPFGEVENSVVSTYQAEKGANA